MRLLNLIFTFLLLSICSFGQQAFYKVFSGLGYDVGKGIVELSDSSYVVCGSSTSWEGSSQAFLMKVDSIGTRAWTNHYGGPESDGATRILYKENLGLFTVGFTNSIGAAGDYNGLVMHMDVNGTLIWEQKIGSDNAWEFIHDAVFVEDSSILCVGESQNLEDGDKDVFIARISKDGELIWSLKYANPGVDYATSITNIEDSLFVVGGTFYCADSLTQKGFVMKINNEGSILWRDTLGNYSGKYVIEDVSIAVDKINAVGAREVDIDNHDSYLLKLNFDGDILFEQTENDPNGESDVIMDEIAFIPSVNKNIIGFKVINAFSFQDDYDANIGFFNENSFLWMNNFTSINYLGLDEVNQLVPTSDGAFVGVGQTTYPISGGSNVFILKYSLDEGFPNTAEYYTIDTLVGVDSNLETETFDVSPNPCHQSVFIDFHESWTRVKILNGFGQVISDKELSLSEPMDVSWLKSGIYYVQIENQTRKIIKL